MISQDQPEVGAEQQPAAQSPTGGARAFVRTPFRVRCNVVRVWRPLPADLWTALTQPDDRPRAAHVERRALAGVLLMAALLMTVISGVGYRPASGAPVRSYPLLGKSLHTPEAQQQGAGWYFNAWETISLAFWVVGPSLAGWAFVRLMWIPAAATSPARQATLTMARHLGAVYRYVYAMVMAGTILMVPLIRWLPAETELFRWCFWCFLFGESFFVPAAMWIRLVAHDRQGRVFGRFRFPVLGVYLLLFVVVPIWGMVRELD